MMITCTVCGTNFLSVDAFEKHLDADCYQNELTEQAEIIGTQIIRNGKSTFKILDVDFKISRRKVTDLETDDKETEPLKHV